MPPIPSLEYTRTASGVWKSAPAVNSHLKLDYAADGNYEEVAQFVVNQTKTDYEAAYAERGVADWFTGKEVAAGAADGSIEAYYKVQQDNFIAAGAVEGEVPVADYVMFDNMIEAGK